MIHFTSMIIGWILICVVCLASTAAFGLYWHRRSRYETRLRECVEQRLLAMTENLRIGVFQVRQRNNEDFVVEFCNEIARQLARFPIGQEAETSLPSLPSLLQYIDAADKQHVERRINECFVSGHEFVGTFRFLFPNGQLGWILVDAKSEEDAVDGRLWNGCIVDLTRERALSNKLSSTLIPRDAFVAGAAHELRTPVQNISMALDAMNANQLYESDAQRLSAARIAASDLEDLVNDFMEISNITAGVARIRSEPFDLHEVISSTCRSFEGVSQATGVKYKRSVEADVPRFIYGDSLRLKQILYNVIGNAFKYTDMGEVSLSVCCTGETCNDQKLRRVEFTIRDTGIGIPTQYTPVIFEPFATVGDHPGSSSGLGLAICDRLVSLLDGTISVNSEEGAGSTFTVSLPCVVSHNDADDPDVLSQTADLFGDTLSMTLSLEEVDMEDRDTTRQDAEDIRDSSSNTVIVVDDSYMVRDMLASLLELEGWSVMQADSGTEALAILAEHECRAVITDHKMPYMTGLELGISIDAQFAGSASRPLLIIMSGGMPADDLEAAKQYFDVVLSKPVRAAQIHAAIISNNRSLELA